MASKKDEFKYLSMPVLSGQQTAKITKTDWGGLNRRSTVDSGELSAESNISTAEFPRLTPAERLKEFGVTDKYYDGKEIISLHGFDDFLMTVYLERAGDTFDSPYELKIDYITLSRNQNNANTIHTGILKAGLKTQDQLDTERETRRSIVQFNMFTDSTDVLNGHYKKKILIFPDRVSMGYQIINTAINPNDIEDPDYDAIYCLEKSGNKYYYKWNGNSGAFKQYTGTNISPTFEFKELYTDFKTFYSDGYVISNDEFSETQTYYRRIKTGAPYEYVEKVLTAPEKDEDDKEIIGPNTYVKGKYYVSTSDFSPATCGETISTTDGTYLNTYNSCMYAYDDTDGWVKTVAPNCPKIKLAAVYRSRLFGVDDKRVYASAFNDYSDFVLDSIDDENERNAWCSAAQSNTKADGAFTGITVYNDRVVLFKKDFLQEAYGLNNPFRIVDMGTVGTIDNRTVQEVGGLLYFVSEDDVKVYNGAVVKSVGYKLNIDRFKSAVSGSDGRFYYLWCYLSDGGEQLFVYDTLCGRWSQRFCDYEVLSFAKTSEGMFMLTSNGDTQRIYRIDSGVYTNVEWSFDTDIMTSSSADIKHLTKLQVLADLEEGSEINVYAVYDNDAFDENTSQLLYSRANVTGRKITVPIRVKPRLSVHCGCMLHFCGKGYVKLYSMEIFTSEGGGLYG